MGFVCKLVGHKWQGCKCTKCSVTRDEEHSFETVLGKCQERCSNCGKTQDISHKWQGCKCTKCGATRDEAHSFKSVAENCKKKCSICGKSQNIQHQYVGDNCKICGEVNPDIFCMTVCNKFTAFGGLFAEGKDGKGTIKVGDRVFIYSEKGKLKYDGVIVTKLLLNGGASVQSVTIGDGKTYAEIMLNGVHDFSDIDYKDIISKQKIDFESILEDKPTSEAKPLPAPKTYNDPDRKAHINMATDDLASMAASGNLAKNRDWVRNVAQDLYDAHGFSAMQEVFINVKTRYPMMQTQLSSLWDGVGGWAD